VGGAEELNSTNGELHGGVANTGLVVRIGATVRRPRIPQSEGVNAFLRHLRMQGISWVPEPQGIDESGRQIFTWLPGRAVTEPLAPWSVSNELLIAVARRQRQLHLGATGFAAPASPWAVTAGDYFPVEAFDAASLVFAHNDLSTSNVLVNPDDATEVCGIIDFDYVRAVDRLFDIAVAIRHWAPVTRLRADEWGLEDADRVHRFALFCDVHQLTNDERNRVVDLMGAFLMQARTNVEALAESGRPGFVALIANGYLDSNAESLEWVHAHRSQLVGT